jgi:predicted small metal-binding protein
VTACENFVAGGMFSSREDAASAPTPTLENTMSRKYIDCRDYPSDSNCTVAISADTEQELLEVAVQHAVTIHGHEDSPQFRDELRKAIKVGTPPA